MYSVGYPDKTIETFLEWLWITIYSVRENPRKTIFQEKLLVSPLL